MEQQGGERTHSRSLVHIIALIQWMIVRIDPTHMDVQNGFEQKRRVMRGQLLMQSLALAAVCVQPLMVSLAVAERICEDKSQYVGGCFSVQGKLFVSNGTPSVKIIAKGQREQLGVFNDGDIEGRALPDEVAKLISTETRIYGQFQVCPLTEAMPKEIQMVCLISGKNLIVRKSH